MSPFVVKQQPYVGLKYTYTTTATGIRITVHSTTGSTATATSTEITFVSPDTPYFPTETLNVNVPLDSADAPIESMDPADVISDTPVIPDPIEDVVIENIEDEPLDDENLVTKDTSHLLVVSQETIGIDASTVGLSQYGSDPIRPVIDYSSDTLSAPLIYHNRHRII